MTTFTALGLAEPILKAITDTGYETPTPIQLQAIPPVLAGKDVLGIAQTGTGKTAAFALPILNQLAANRKPTPRRGVRTLILSPTRELASQIAESFRTYGKHLGFTVAVVFGGVSERPQADRLRSGVDILVATPGRLLDHMGQGNVTLVQTEIFVLDEADQMLDLGFFKPIRRIVADLPKVRQSLFFSATMPKEIEELTRELLTDPTKVAVTPESTTVERVTQRVVRVEQSKKKALLAELLADEAMARTLVFTRTKRGADRVAKHLLGAKINASAIHGNKSQNQREAALHGFKAGHIRVLVATDIAARGIDIDEVSHVVNYELPEVPEAYVHRIGRTARAGASGSAISFCDEGERHLLRDIERLTRQAIDAEDRRNDDKLIADKPGKGQQATGEPRDGERPSAAREEARRGFRGHDRGRDRNSRPWTDRKPEHRVRGDRAERGEGAPQRERSHRSEHSNGEGRPARAFRPERRDGERGGFEHRGRSGADRSGPPRQESRGRTYGDRPQRDREERGDRVWTNDGSRPDRQHRREEGDRSDSRGPRHDGPRQHRGERREGAPAHRDQSRPDGRFNDKPREYRGDRGDRSFKAREGERAGHGGDRPRYNSNRPRSDGEHRGPDRGNGEHRADRSRDDSRPQGDRAGGWRGEGRRHDGPRSQGPRHDGPRRDGQRSDGPRRDGDRTGGYQGRGRPTGAPDRDRTRSSGPAGDRYGQRPAGNRNDGGERQRFSKPAGDRPQWRGKGERRDAPRPPRSDAEGA